MGSKLLLIWAGKDNPWAWTIPDLTTKGESMIPKMNNMEKRYCWPLLIRWLIEFEDTQSTFRAGFSELMSHYIKLRLLLNWIGGSWQNKDFFPLGLESCKNLSLSDHPTSSKTCKEILHIEKEQVKWRSNCFQNKPCALTYLDQIHPGYWIISIESSLQAQSIFLVEKNSDHLLRFKSRPSLITIFFFQIPLAFV